MISGLLLFSIRNMLRTPSLICFEVRGRRILRTLCSSTGLGVMKNGRKVISVHYRW